MQVDIIVNGKLRLVLTPTTPVEEAVIQAMTDRSEKGAAVQLRRSGTQCVVEVDQ